MWLLAVFWLRPCSVLPALPLIHSSEFKHRLDPLRLPSPTSEDTHVYPPARGQGLGQLGHGLLGPVRFQASAAPPSLHLAAKGLPLTALQSRGRLLQKARQRHPGAPASVGGSSPAITGQSESPEPPQCGRAWVILTRRCRQSSFRA